MVLPLFGQLFTENRVGLHMHITIMVYVNSYTRLLSLIKGFLLSRALYL